VGELWYDCTTGYLKVFQNCVDPQGWTNVAEPGLPVKPTLTTATPNFVRGLGTVADPYECTVATVASGSSIFIVNEVTVTGLAPNQFVPIVDLNAVTNGGRFHFTNNYANASGVLKFQTVFIDLPASLSGTNYTGLIRVGWATAYIEAFINIINPMILISPGSISGTARVGSVLTYVQGTASGGVTPLNYNWTWEDDQGNPLQPGGFSYIVQQTDLGRDIFVSLVVTDSATPPNSVSGDTNLIGPIVNRPIPIPTDWNPTPTDGMDFVPGGISGPYTGPGTSATSTGCILVSVNGAPFDQGPQALQSGDNLAIEWSMSSICGGAPSGTILTGTVSDGVGTNEYTVTVDRLPSPFGFNTLTDVQPNSQHVSSTVGVNNINATAYVTLNAGNTAPAPLELTKDGGTTWFTVPAAPSTILSVNSGDNIQLRFTTGAALGQLYTGLINIGDGDNVKFTPSAPGFRVTNAINPVFPNTNFNPIGGPNAAPVTVNIPAQSLYGKATATWADSSVSTPLTTTGALRFQVNGGGYGTGPTNVINGDIVDICWDLTQVNAAADGTTVSGSLTDGLYSNSYNLTIDRATDGYDFSDLTNQLLNTPVVSNTVAPIGFNVPIQLTYAVGTPNTLTSVQANIATTGFFNVPTAAPGLFVNPGQNIQLKATSGTANTTPYSITTTLGTGGSATDLWTVTTGSTAPLVVTPSITSPNNGAGGVATTVNVTGSAYINQNGAGTQASSDWQIYKAIPSAATTSSIVSIGQGAGNTQVTYSDRFTAGANLQVFQPTPGQPYLVSQYSATPSTGTPAGPQAGGGLYGPRLGFDGNTATNYGASVYAGSAAPLTPAATALYNNFTGWYPSRQIPFGTSVEVWGTGIVRTTVNGVAGPEITLTPGAWNIVNIGTGNLQAIEWKPTVYNAPVTTLAYVDISLNAVRVDGVILTDASLGEQSYSTGWPGGTRVSGGNYQVPQPGGGRQGPMVAFDGDTSTSYQVETFFGGVVSPVPPPQYSGWYPLVPVPVTTSVRIWGTGIVRAVINGVGQTPVTLTAGAWNVLYIGGGNLTGVEWQNTLSPFGGGVFAVFNNATCNAIEVDGTILTDASLGQAPYSTRFTVQNQFQGIAPWGGGGVSANAYTTAPTGGRGGVMNAFDGNTATNYTVLLNNVAAGVSPPPAVRQYTGWYPTVPLTVGTSVEVWGSGKVRAVINGVPQTVFTCTTGAWTVIYIGTGVLNSIEWEGVTFTTSPGFWAESVTINVNAIRVDGTILTDLGTNPTTVLTLSNNTNLSSFAIGDTVREINAGGGVGDAQGTIVSVNSATPSITVETTAGTWTIGSSVQKIGGTPVDPGPPTTNPPNPLVYTQIVDVTGDTTNLTSYPLVGLASASIFYARVQYNSNLIVTSSGFSAWSKFTTV
jgi:hypothetical protein